jgi:hypothetical protein
MPSDSLHDELVDLAFAVCDGTASDEQIERTEELLAGDPGLRLLYLQCLELHFEMGRRRSTPTGEERLQPEITSPPSPVPPIIIDASSDAPGPRLAGLLSPGSFVFSYGMSAAIVGIGLLIGWAWRISRDQQVADGKSARPPAATAVAAKAAAPFVGQITGIVDCRWADPRTKVSERDYVPLGSEYAILSGFIEITYDGGAKVILQGPATFEIDSARGGFLSLGKLTARVESRESRGQSREAKRERTANPSPFQSGTAPTASLAPRPSSVSPLLSGRAAGGEGDSSPRPSTLDSGLSTPDSPLFSVRTPTAVVTDLGTEFGVEVGKDGNTNSHVFRGSVRVRLVGEKDERRDAILHENESARAEEGDGAGGPRLVLRGVAVDPRDFVRRMAEAPIAVDLLDIVAGGNGRGHLRDRGIDPTTGMEDLMFYADWRDGDRQFRPVAGQRLIDGVFVPSGGAGPVQLDSAGHTFDDFRPTRGNIWGSIWSRAARSPIRPEDYQPKHEVWIRTMGPGDEYMPERRGLLALAPNAGLTFDLVAIRKAHPEFAGPLRFRASASLANPNGLADILVFVDGQLKLQRMGLRQADGVIRVDMRLGPDDKFLTLASTDGGNGVQSDWIVFGDPILSAVRPEGDSVPPKPTAMNPR